MYSNSTAWFSGSQLRVHLDIQVGEHAIDYANVAQKEKLTELQLRIRQLLDQVDQITKEQNYQRVIGTLIAFVHGILMVFLITFFSTGRSDSVKPVTVQTSVFYGGRLRKPLSS